MKILGVIETAPSTIGSMVTADVTPPEVAISITITGTITFIKSIIEVKTSFPSLRDLKKLLV